MMRSACRAMLPAVLVLTACSGGNPPSEPEALSPVAAFMASALPATSARLDDPDFGSGILVTQEEAFVSASSEDCRRATVITREREAEMVVICRTEQGRPWKMLPRIMGHVRP